MWGRSGLGTSLLGGCSGTAIVSGLTRMCMSLVEAREMVQGAMLQSQALVVQLEGAGGEVRVGP